MVTMLRDVIVILEKIAGHREYDAHDYENAAQYKPDEGIWAVNEYLADYTLDCLKSEPMFNLPDDDSDFTPDIARDIIEKYQVLVAILQNRLKLQTN